MSRKVAYIIGKKFGRLTVIENTNIKAHGSTLHKCICDCGNEILVPKSYLMSKHTTSCGCYSQEIHTTHNKCNTRLYKIFCSMKKRCENESERFYKDYGGRGIKICDEWKKDFLSFYNWAIENGYADNLTIDRINVNGNYEPNNCRWITKGEQTRNTRRNVFITYNGKTQLICDWSRETGIPNNTLSRRYKHYDDLDKVFYKGDLKCQKKKSSK